jgi:hypothetical protein
VRVHQRYAILPLVLCSLSFFAYVGAPNADDEPPMKVPFCDLLSAPRKYDHREVATEALIQSSGHEVHVYSPKCRNTSTGDRSASIELPGEWQSTKLGKRLSKILRHDRTAKVTFEAVFQSSGGPYGSEGTRFHFVLRRLASVEELSRQEASGARKLTNS